MTPGCGDAADRNARCCRARPIIGHRQDQVQASLSDYADERADHPYMCKAMTGAGCAVVAAEALPTPLIADYLQRSVLGRWCDITRRSS